MGNTSIVAFNFNPETTFKKGASDNLLTVPVGKHWRVEYFLRREVKNYGTVAVGQTFTDNDLSRILLNGTILHYLNPKMISLNFTGAAVTVLNVTSTLFEMREATFSSVSGSGFTASYNDSGAKGNFFGTGSFDGPGGACSLSLEPVGGYESSNQVIHGHLWLKETETIRMYGAGEFSIEQYA